MGEKKTIYSTCLGCLGNCGAIYEVEDNTIVRVKGNPDSPLTKGFICPKGRAVEEIRSSPERLRNPLKRSGNRGEGKWFQISWDEALQEIADNLLRIKKEYGPESVSLAVGFSGVLAGLDPVLGKFVHSFGTPNRLVDLHNCAMPGHIAGVHTCGFSLLFDPDFKNSKCVVVWGIDIENSYRANHYYPIKKAIEKGAKLIVIDPRKTGLADKADIYLQIRPGTDGALALGMLNCIINEELYNKEFVEQWTVGFDKLKAHVQEYTPEKVSEITWIPPQSIREAARMYAHNTPAAIGTGTGGLCQNTNVFQTNRAIAILASITANLDCKGGHVNHPVSLKDKGTMVAQYDAAFKGLSNEQINKRLWLGRVVKADGILNAHPERVWPAIRENTPYSVKAMLAIASNSVITKENSKFVRDTLMKLDFLAVSELFMTPTAEIADIVLPAAHWSERKEVIDAYTKNYLLCHRKIVEPPEECWEDKKILVELAKRLEMDDFYKSVEEALNDRLLRLGLTFDQFADKGMIENPIEYKKHEKFGGFKTASKKIELYSDSLKALGSDPLPVFREPPESPVSSPELTEKYPLILVTGKKSLGYFHGSYRNIASLRKLDPEPQLLIHPETAKLREIEDSEWLEIESPRGVVKHKAKISDRVDPRVVVAPHGWWYGYKDGWKEVNINVLTEGKIYDPDVGSGVLKGLLCEVRKAKSAPVKI